MKKHAYIPIFLSLTLSCSFLLSLTACGNAHHSGRESNATSIKAELSTTAIPESRETKALIKDDQNEPSAVEAIQQEEASADLQSITVDDVTFSVAKDWEHTPMDGYEGTFMTPEQDAAYQLQGVSSLGSYTPDAFYQELKDFYSKSYEITQADDTLTTDSMPDGVECYIGHIEMTARSTNFSIDVLIAPQKNKVATFAAQCAEGNTPPVDIREVSNTAVFEVGTEDIVHGNTFLANDGSELCLADDNTFLYYQSADDHSGAYCTGTYESLYGQAAIDKLASMTEYGLTKEELEQTLSADMNGYTPGGSSPTDFLDSEEDANTDTGYHVCTDTFYAVILHNEQMVEASGETSAMGNDTVYLGYYIPELSLVDMLNANTANYAEWTLQGKTE